MWCPSDRSIQIPCEPVGARPYRLHARHRRLYDLGYYSLPPGTWYQTTDQLRSVDGTVRVLLDRQLIRDVRYYGCDQHDRSGYRRHQQHDPSGGNHGRLSFPQSFRIPVDFVADMPDWNRVNDGSMSVRAQPLSLHEFQRRALQALAAGLSRIVRRLEHAPGRIQRRVRRRLGPLHQEHDQLLAEHRDQRRSTATYPRPRAITSDQPVHA